MRRIAGLAFLCLALAARTPAQEALCATYEPDEIALEGVLRLTLQPGPPHFRSVESGDMPEPVWMFTPDHPLCLDGIPGDAWSVAMTGIAVVEVIPRTPLAAALNGARVRVLGSLARPRVGHPRSVVVLRAVRTEPGTPH